MSPQQKKFVFLLASSDTTEAFLQKVSAEPKGSFGKFTYASFARKAGFSSRSFVRQLFLGKRKINLANCRAVSKGFGFPREASQYLSLLVERENSSGQIAIGLDQQIQKSKERLFKALDVNSLHLKNRNPVGYQDWPFVYAALGDAKIGASLSMISKLSKISTEKCKKLLEEMEKADLVTSNPENGRYFAKYNFVNVDQLGGAESFKQLFIKNTNEQLYRAKRNFADPEALFYSGVVSVKKSDLPALAKAFQELLAQFIQEVESSDGDQLAIINASLFSN